MTVAVSDLVVVIGDPHEIVYVVEKITEGKVYISGLHYRVRKIVAADEIMPATPQQVAREQKKTDAYFQNITSVRRKRNKNYLLGKILHIDGDKKYSKSTAALHIAKHLSGGYPLLYAFMVFPKFFRDWIYDIIAKNRYKWFGKKESCMIPTPELQDKFL